MFERNHYHLSMHAKQVEELRRQEEMKNLPSGIYGREDTLEDINQNSLKKLLDADDKVEWWVEQDQEEFRRVKAEYLENKRRQALQQQAYKRPLRRQSSEETTTQAISTSVLQSQLHPGSKNFLAG